jgi:hypothetical protein
MRTEDNRKLTAEDGRIICFGKRELVYGSLEHEALKKQKRESYRRNKAKWLENRSKLYAERKAAEALLDEKERQKIADERMAAYRRGYEQKKLRKKQQEEAEKTVRPEYEELLREQFPKMFPLPQFMQVRLTDSRLPVKIENLIVWDSRTPWELPFAFETEEEHRAKARKYYANRVVNRIKSGK